MPDTIYNVDTGAIYFDNMLMIMLMISTEDVNLFLLKQTYRYYLLVTACVIFLSINLLFISKTMDVFCLAGSSQQAQQSTHLAEVLKPL